MSTPTTSPSDVTPEDAYAAARDRALRTADALIGAEAQVRSLTRRLDEQIAANRKLVERLDRYTDPHEPMEGGGQDAEESDPTGYLAAIGQAD